MESLVIKTKGEKLDILIEVYKSKNCDKYDSLLNSIMDIYLDEKES